MKKFDELFERTISILADRILDRVRRGLYRHYVEKDDDLAFVRGRIDVRGNIANIVRLTPAVSCRFEELTPELEDNEILLWTMYVASRVSLSRPEVALKVRRAYRALIGTVGLKEKTPADCISRIYNRLNEDYRPMHGLCRLVMEHAGPDLAVGDKRFLPFIVDMPLLFEAFVAKWLNANLPSHIKLDEQHSARLDSNVRLDFKIDILLRERDTDRPIAVLDTKYKAWDKPKSEDIQQVVAYAVRMGVSQAFLIYPSDAGSDVTAFVGPSRPGDGVGVSVRSLVLILILMWPTLGDDS